MKKLFSLIVSRYTVSVIICFLPYCLFWYLLRADEDYRMSIMLLHCAVTVCGLFTLSFSTMTEDGKRLWRWFILLVSPWAVTALALSKAVRARNLYYEKRAYGEGIGNPKFQEPISRNPLSEPKGDLCNSTFDFIGDGGEYFDMLIRDITEAKKSIYLEYYIIAEGVMLSRLFPVLSRKAREGCSVMLVYDAIGSLGRLSRRSVMRLRGSGVATRAFNLGLGSPMTLHNSRDHRKLAVIDGRIFYVGGFNLADEYANLSNHFGHWKDCAVRIVGEYIGDFKPFISGTYKQKDKSPLLESSSRIRSYSSLPRHLSATSLSKTHYMNIISSARRYLYIATPYLVPDEEAAEEICRAIERGVDVRIVIPRVKDKLLVGLVTKEFGRYFAKRGATVYEYTPGFIHQKSATADGKMCIIGSANLDQRSFYHNFECGVTLYDSDITRQVERDFTLISELSERINAEEKMTVISAFFGAVGRFISSLL